VLAQQAATAPDESADGPSQAVEAPDPHTNPAEAELPPVLVHRFENLSIELTSDDVLYIHTYLDPFDAPRAILVEWQDADSVEHRAYWGENVFEATTPADGMHDLGPLPEPGSWVRLTVPASQIALGTDRIQAMTIKQAGGTAYWDKAGVLRSPIGGPAAAVGDAVWALLTSPEFQYIR
jgi:hypothetical protein